MNPSSAPMMSPTEARLKVDIRLALDRFELRAAFELGEGVTAFFGPSGSGKTSLLETLAGLRRKAEGTIRLGADTWLDSERRLFVPPEGRWIGYVPQEGLLFPHLNVRQNLLAGNQRVGKQAAGPNVTPARDSGTELETVAALLELEPLLHRPVTTLSGGERQRVALGRALCSGPRLLLLDEPLAALDLPLRRRLLPFLRRIRSELTVPMILVSHDPVEVQALCDEVLVFRDGSQVARGTPRRVLADPEVFSLGAADRSHNHFENVLPGQLRRGADGSRTIHLGSESSEGDASGSGVEVDAGPGAEPPEGSVLLGLSADDILIATEPPTGLSARNVLPALVTEATFHEGRALVHVRLVAPKSSTGKDGSEEKIPELVVEVTKSTVDRLGLQPGRSIHLVLKATACRLYSSNPASPGSSPVEILEELPSSDAS